MADAESLSAALTAQDEAGVDAAVAEQSTRLSEIQTAYSETMLAQKYGFEQEGAVAMAGYMATLAATAFAALI